MALTYEPHLLQLSDDVLLQIMSILKLEDILTLSKVCQRLEKISRDRTLWREVDLQQKFLDNSELEKVFQCFHKGTKSLALVGSLEKFKDQPGWNTECLTPSLFATLTELATVENLILKEHYVNASKLVYTCFPTTLRCLSMENCFLTNVPTKKSYFNNMASHTPLLESLNLNGCQWFEDHSLMAISKCPKLTSLQVRNCPLVGTCAAYILLAARFGFENLKVLDLRETAIGDGEIHAFKTKPNLKQLYIDGTLHRKKRSEDIDRVSDRGFYIPGENAPNLEVLILTNTEVTDLTLRHLGRNLPSLQIIDVRATKVSAEGIRRIKADFAHLQVICDWPEWCSDLSQLRSDCWIDNPLAFKNQPELPRLPPPVPLPASTNGRNERIELVFVEPGMVTLRRVIDPTVPVPAQAPVQEDPPVPDNPGPSLDNPNP